MNIIKKVFNLIKHPKNFGLHFMLLTARIWPDKVYLKIIYKLNTGNNLNLKEPHTFNEKLQWLKLYNRRPEYTMMVDKVKVKEYVSSIIGQEYIIPTIGIWEKVEDIDFTSLPDKFVIKCNHNSGLGMYICKDKSRMDIVHVSKELMKGLNENYYIKNREWPYKNVPRRILVEKFMDDGTEEDLKDYKFFCFNGEPKYCQLITNRSISEKIDWYDMNWNLVVGLKGLTHGIPNSGKTFTKPKSFDRMKELVVKLAKSINSPFARIDLYEIKGHPYFGEITFFPAAGLGSFIPDSYNITIGSFIDLPNKK